MANLIIPHKPDAEALLAQMREDARFEIASDSDSQPTVEGVCEGDESLAAALRSADNIRSKRAPSKVDKVFMAGKCKFNCAYCGCRCSREEKQGYCLEPREFAELTLAAAKMNGHGVFLTSAIWQSADYTQEKLAETARILREELDYHRYLHVKVMPGADPKLIAETGRYADRLSVNIEVAHSSGYAMIAKQKSRELILSPMADIANQIAGAKFDKQPFATTQTTQLMAGSTGESDRAIITLADALYKKYRLRRVYYTAFRYEHDAKGYDPLPHTVTPYWRMARLYQADRLLQLYNFTPEDVLPEDYADLERDIDPKAAWALRHISMFPVEVNTADFDTLIRVPGIGLTYAKRIIEVRRFCKITHEIMKKMRIPLRRCELFITCDGSYTGGTILDNGLARDVLVTGDAQLSIADSLAESVEAEGVGQGETADSINI